MILVDILEDARWPVVEFDNADDAIAFYRRSENEIAAVFTDINMPGCMDGLDLAAIVAAFRPTAVLVVTSGRYQEPPADPSKHVRFLPKPWNERSLLNAVREIKRPEPTPSCEGRRPCPAHAASHHDPERAG